MPKNDEGEFELVLGNRQLISVFLIVVILLGVFFSMGYIVGRNSSPASVDTARNEKPKPDHDADSSDNAPADAPPDITATPPAAGDCDQEYAQPCQQPVAVFLTGCTSPGGSPTP